MNKFKFLYFIFFVSFTYNIYAVNTSDVDINSATSGKKRPLEAACDQQESSSSSDADSVHQHKRQKTKGNFVPSSSSNAHALNPNLTDEELYKLALDCEEKEDCVEAYKIYEKLIKKNKAKTKIHLDSLFHKICMLRDGQGVEKNILKALELAEKKFAQHAEFRDLYIESLEKLLDELDQKAFKEDRDILVESIEIEDVKEKLKFLFSQWKMPKFNKTIYILGQLEPLYERAIKLRSFVIQNFLKLLDAASKDNAAKHSIILADFFDFFINTYSSLITYNEKEDVNQTTKALDLFFTYNLIKETKNQLSDECFLCLKVGVKYKHLISIFEMARFKIEIGENPVSLYKMAYNLDAVEAYDLLVEHYKKSESFDELVKFLESALLKGYPNAGEELAQAYILQRCKYVRTHQPRNIDEWKELFFYIKDEYNSLDDVKKQNFVQTLPFGDSISMDQHNRTYIFDLKNARDAGLEENIFIDNVLDYLKNIGFNEKSNCMLYVSNIKALLSYNILTCYEIFKTKGGNFGSSSNLLYAGAGRNIIIHPENQDATLEERAWAYYQMVTSVWNHLMEIKEKEYRDFLVTRFANEALGSNTLCMEGKLKDIDDWYSKNIHLFEGADLSKKYTDDYCLSKDEVNLICAFYEDLRCLALCDNTYQAFKRDFESYQKVIQSATSDCVNLDQTPINLSFLKTILCDLNKQLEEKETILLEKHKMSIVEQFKNLLVGKMSSEGIIEAEKIKSTLEDCCGYEIDLDA
ncbi:MAG: hypothetical protein Q8S31_07100 [Alphaproteobacteria bacterium]|nr:hypothetical protein [Alphaproteobacteria bacterium]